MLFSTQFCYDKHHIFAMFDIAGIYDFQKTGGSISRLLTRIEYDLYTHVPAIQRATCVHVLSNKRTYDRRSSLNDQ